MGKKAKTCCRSKPRRCSDCPVVLLRLGKIANQNLTGKKLRRAVKAAKLF